MKNVQFILLLCFLLLINVDSEAQFVSKLELCIHGGVQSLTKFEIPVNSNTMYSEYTVLPENEENIVVSDAFAILSSFDLWYNATSKLAIGVTGGAIVGQNISGVNDNYSSENYKLEYSDHSFMGLALKYYFLNKPKLKLYGRLNAKYFIQSASFFDSNHIQKDPNDNSQVWGGGWDETEGCSFDAIGIHATIGSKLYFGDAFGMMLECGFSSNEFVQGPTATGGFFFDLFRK